MNRTQLKPQVQLSAFVGTRVKLKRRGADWFGCCPFHEEKTASFTVNDTKGFYHCFGCSAHGDVLDWWQHFEGLTFSEACGRLEREAGQADRSSDQRPRTSDDNAATKRKQVEAQRIWTGALPAEATVVADYLRDARGIHVRTPDALRGHRGLMPDPRLPDTCPAMIAAVTVNAGVKFHQVPE